ncbi:phosphatidylglycerophosphatase A [Magnetospira sp. QH-2]|uniref:phosphatidylglycerophosphatase A family protein n=1 Tax=Magnetospira sp. (strain QH-2) TaxID=1288970 RepID=UPI0003E8137A|nr:phosphatidylglycerophosphatase A [Magnetospira sp. QH-2]CCQ73470.1 Phosphatidylglycerophosphatase A [Magnetospira sp. QH-2]
MSLLNPVTLLATWFGSGLLPRMPGTWGSIAALPFAWILVGIGGWPLLLAATAVIFPVGVWSGGLYATREGREDPGPVVIDEVAGQWLTLVVVPLDPLLYGIGFLLFRVFDITKPWPVSLADRKIKGGLGIMLDDILAAFYAAPLLYGAAWALGRVG